MGFTVKAQFIAPTTTVRGVRFASYMHDDLYNQICDVAGEGHPMRWHDEYELARNFSNTPYFQWGWVADGDYSWELADMGQNNTRTHMRILFRDPAKAILTRLTI